MDRCRNGSKLRILNQIGSITKGGYKAIGRDHLSHHAHGKVPSRSLKSDYGRGYYTFIRISTTLIEKHSFAPDLLKQATPL